MVRIRIINSMLGIVFLCCACTEKDKRGRPLDTPTAGDIKIAVDESLRPLLEAEVDAFEGIYKQANVHVNYTSEAEAIEALLNDSVRLAVVTRRLVGDEISMLMKDKIVPVQTDIATGAVALIIHRNNHDSLLRISQLKEIFKGKITNWNQLNSTTASSSITIVFDNPKSGIVRFLRDSIANGEQLPSNCFAVKTNQAVVEYVSKNASAIGLIGVEWISDHDDSTANQFLNTIRVMSLAGDSSYFKPYQAYVALHQYPLCRGTIIISREARAGLGSGFTAFVASDKGQRIVLKAGLVPTTMPVRIVEINRDSR